MTDDDKKTEGTEDKEDQEDQKNKAEKKEKPSEPSESSESLKPQVKVGKKLEGIIKDIEELSVLELSELVKALETKFGVTAAAPVAAAAGPAPVTGGEEAASEQTTFNVVLADSGTNKISVIKVLREIN